MITPALPAEFTLARPHAYHHTGAVRWILSHVAPHTWIVGLLLLIAHRLSTVKAADRIVVMHQGRLLETGSHAQLLAQGRHYATLYNTYFRHQSLAHVEEARAWARRGGD